MTIILFLVDTSASMLQRTYLGTNILDVAKSAIETFVKVRTKDPAVRGQDRYMLLTFDEPPDNVKVGWIGGQSVFLDQLKRVSARGLSTMGQALGETLKFLNTNRMIYGTDYYGHGRYPHLTEQAVVVCITDGGTLTDNAGVNINEVWPFQITVPVGTSLGSELTMEPFRWDQRIYSLVLRYPAHRPPDEPPPAPIPCDPHQIDAMCGATGGRSYSVCSHAWLQPAIENLISLIHHTGVTVRLERVGEPPAAVCETPAATDGLVNGDIRPDSNGLSKGLTNGVNQNDQNLANCQPQQQPQLTEHAGKQYSAVQLDLLANPGVWSRLATMVYVNKNQKFGQGGNWPIPEAFWPDANKSQLPPRSAHPVLCFRCESAEPLVCNEFPFDKYELAPSPLTQLLLARKQPNVCWKVYIRDSARPRPDGRDNVGHAFGYIKAASNLQCVNLLVLPYNYERLFPLLDQVRQNPKLRTSSKFVDDFNRYLRSVPPYYYSCLRKALGRLQLSGLVTAQESIYNWSVILLLEKTKNVAKQEYGAQKAWLEQRWLEQGYTQPSANAGLQPPPVLLESNAPVDRAPLKAPHRERASVSAALSVGRMERLAEGHPAFVDRVKSLSQQLAADESARLRLHFAQPSTSSAPLTGSQLYRDPLLIPRASLLQQLHKMRVNLRLHLTARPDTVLEGGLPGLHLKLQHAEDLHQQPVGVMSNFADYQKCTELSGAAPLKSIEAAPVRVHAFGNPFKLEKGKMFVDEADIDRDLLSESPSDAPGKQRKHHKAAAAERRAAKRKGALPRLYTWQARKRARAADQLDARSLPANDLDTTSVASTSADYASDRLSIVSEPPDLAALTAEAAAADDNDVSAEASDANASVSSAGSPPKCLRLQINDSGGGGFGDMARQRYDSTESEPRSPTIEPLFSPTGSGSELDVSISAGNGDDPTSSTRPPPMDAEKMSELRRRIARLVRAPGRCRFRHLLSLITSAPCRSDRDLLLAATVTEAGRFKRHSLLDWLHDEDTRDRIRLSTGDPPDEDDRMTTNGGRQHHQLKSTDSIDAVDNVDNSRTQQQQVKDKLLGSSNHLHHKPIALLQPQQRT